MSLLLLNFTEFLSSKCCFCSPFNDCDPMAFHVVLCGLIMVLFMVATDRQMCSLWIYTWGIWIYEDSDMVLLRFNYGTAVLLWFNFGTVVPIVRWWRTTTRRTKTVLSILSVDDYFNEMRHVIKYDDWRMRTFFKNFQDVWYRVIYWCNATECDIFAECEWIDFYLLA